MASLPSRKQTKLKTLITGFVKGRRAKLSHVGGGNWSWRTQRDGSVTATRWGRSDCGPRGPTMWPLVLDSGPDPDPPSPAQRCKQVAWKWIIDRLILLLKPLFTHYWSGGKWSEAPNWNAGIFSCSVRRTPNLNVSDMWHVRHWDKSNNLPVSCKCFPVNKHWGYRYSTDFARPFLRHCCGGKSKKQSWGITVWQSSCDI